MSRIWTLLQLALIGCRDAASAADAMRTTEERDFAQSVFDAIQVSNSEQLASLMVSVDKYSRLENEVIKSRSTMYRGLVDAISSESKDEDAIPQSRNLDQVLDVLSKGLRSARDALTAGDLRRCEIEMEHIHNLPSLVCATSHASRAYYLDKERDYYLDRLEKYYGIEERQAAQQRFNDNWNEIAKENQ